MSEKELRTAINEIRFWFDNEDVIDNVMNEVQTMCDNCPDFKDYLIQYVDRIR